MAPSEMLGRSDVGNALPPATAVTKKYAYDGGGNLIYEGWCSPGVTPTTSVAVWTIRKFTYDGSNNLTDEQWADGNTSADNIWDNRASLTYV